MRRIDIRRLNLTDDYDTTVLFCAKIPLNTKTALWYVSTAASAVGSVVSGVASAVSSVASSIGSFFSSWW